MVIMTAFYVGLVILPMFGPLPGVQLHHPSTPAPGEDAAGQKP